MSEPAQSIIEATDPGSQTEYTRHRRTYWDDFARNFSRWEGPRRYYQKRLAEIFRFVVPPGMRILELGCGRGDLLAGLRPSHGVGIDFSPAALKSLRNQMAALEEKRSSVTLWERPADNFEDLDDNSFDTVIVNSVVQCFPSLQYLTKVCEGMLKATKPGGAIFVGDVRSLPLREAFSASVELFQAPSTLPLSDLREKIRRRLSQEREMVISPAFFLALQRRYPQVSRVEIRPKWGSSDNEMTRFRYSATLFLEAQEQK